MASITDEYKAYLQQVESLPKEMVRRGVLKWPSYFQGTCFTIYCDGTAEVPKREKALLTRMGLKPRETKRVGLVNLGELLYSLKGGIDKDQQYSDIPFQLGDIPQKDIDKLRDVFSSIEINVTSCFSPIEGL